MKVVHRTDYNYSEVADRIKETIIKFSNFTPTEVKRARSNAYKLSKKALWKEFIENYYIAYDFALNKAEQRKNNLN